MKKLVALLALTVALSAPAWAATKTVTLSVPSMTCAACMSRFVRRVVLLSCVAQESLYHRQRIYPTFARRQAFLPL